MPRGVSDAENPARWLGFSAHHVQNKRCPIRLAFQKSSNFLRMTRHQTARLPMAPGQTLEASEPLATDLQ